MVEITIKPKKISIKKLLLILIDRRLPRPAIEIEKIIIHKINKKNSNIIIK